MSRRRRCYQQRNTRPSARVRRDVGIDGVPPRLSTRRPPLTEHVCRCDDPCRASMAARAPKPTSRNLKTEKAGRAGGIRGVACATLACRRVERNPRRARFRTRLRRSRRRQRCLKRREFYDGFGRGEHLPCHPVERGKSVNTRDPARRDVFRSVCALINFASFPDDRSFRSRRKTSNTSVG